MIQDLLSRYRPRYVRSLVYMFQSSEYFSSEFLKWYHRTSDFAHVEKRKRLEHTSKALVFLVVAWVLITCVLGIVIVGVTSDGDVSHIIAVVLLVAFPFLLPYALVLLNEIMRVVQIPVEQMMIRRAQETLKHHRGIKIGIAGSYGKTTMREILKTLLAQGKKVAAPPGSYNTPLGICSFVKTLAGDEDVLLFELGEYYPGDIKKLCTFVQPEWGIITGVNEAHLEKFKTLEVTTKTIFELVDYLGEKPVWVNEENARACAAAQARASTIFYSRKGCGAWHIEDPTSDLDGTTFILHTPTETIQMHSQLLGLHMLGSIAAAADIASRLGLTAEQIQFGIAATKPFSHRLEKHVAANGVILLDDSYNGNSDGAQAVISFLGSIKGHRRWYVTPGLVEAGTKVEEVHKTIGRQLAQAGTEKVALMKNSVTPYIEKGLIESGYTGEIVWFTNMPAFLAAMPSITLPGDVVLIQNDWPDQYA